MARLWAPSGAGSATDHLNAFHIGEVER